MLLVGLALPCTYPAPAAAEVAVPAEVAAHGATDAALLRASCSFATGVMARRVVEEGADWAAVTRLVPAPDVLENHVAAPFAVEGDPGLRVVATEVLQLLSEGKRLAVPLALAGRVLEVGEVRYLVLTAYREVNT